jgi:hypothetical protein
MAYAEAGVSAWPTTMMQHAVAASGLVPSVTGCYTEYAISTGNSSSAAVWITHEDIGPGIISNLRYDPRGSYTGTMHIQYWIDGVEIKNDLTVAAYDFVIGWPFDVPDHDDQRMYWPFKHGFKVGIWHHVIPNTPCEVRVIWQTVNWR